MTRKPQGGREAAQLLHLKSRYGIKSWFSSRLNQRQFALIDGGRNQVRPRKVVQIIRRQAGFVILHWTAQETKQLCSSLAFDTISHLHLADSG